MPVTKAFVLEFLSFNVRVLFAIVFLVFLSVLFEQREMLAKGRFVFFLCFFPLVLWGSYKNYSCLSGRVNLFLRLLISLMTILAVVFFGIVLGVNIKLIMGVSI